MRWHLTFGLVLLSLITSAQLQQQIEQLSQQYGLMGISVSAICNGDLIESYHDGIRDNTRSLPVNDNTLYRFASVSKLVTAMALMQLYDNGLFQLDDDVNTELGFSLRNPSHPNVPITYRMLLSHTSGIRDGSGYSGFLSATFSNPGNPPFTSQLLVPSGTYYTTNMWGTQAPGTYFSYSNANYGVIAMLIEKLSGQRFDIVAKTQTFNPLGISGSFNLNDITDINDVAVLYRNVSGNWVAQADNFQGIAPSVIDYSNYNLGTNGFMFGPQGGLRISSTDLTKIMKVLVNQGQWNGVQIIEPSTIQLMLTAQWTYNGSNGNNYYGLFQSWGLGVHLITNTVGEDVIYPSVPLVGHAGEAYGLISDFYFDPATGNGFSFATNGSWSGYALGLTSAWYRVEEDLFNILYQNHYIPCMQSAAVPENNSVSLITFPNPANSILYVRTKHLSGLVLLEVLDMTGKLMTSITEITNCETFSISTENLASGLYILRLTHSNGVSDSRFIKQ